MSLQTINSFKVLALQISMREISPSELTKMLNGKFEGAIKFSGEVILGIAQKGGGIGRFYHGRGDFDLHYHEHDKSYSVSDDQNKHSLLFKRTGQTTLYEDEDDGKQTITMPLDFADGAILELGALKKIIF